MFPSSTFLRNKKEYNNQNKQMLTFSIIFLNKNRLVLNFVDLSFCKEKNLYSTLNKKREIIIDAGLNVFKKIVFLR